MKKLLVLVVALATAAGISVAIATASSAPTVITYEKTCGPDQCVGSTGNGGTITMHVTGGRLTGEAAQLEMSETITVGGRWFIADLSAHFSPAGFIVLNGIVTDSSDPSLVGAQVHQRSNLDPGSGTHWTGELQLMPASA